MGKENNMNDVLERTVEAPVLPMPLPTDHQALMDLFYGHWQASGHHRLQSEIAAVMPAKVNVAVMLGNYCYQVCNGGHSQWDGNGYSKALPGLISIFAAADRLGVENAGLVHKLLVEFDDIRSKDEGRWPSFDDDEDQSDDYGHLDSAYYAIDGEALGQAILDDYDRISGSTFAHCFN